MSNPETSRHTAGIAKETLIVAPDGTGEMKIVSHRETTGAESGSSKARDRRREREHVYDGRPAIPLPPGVPWPPGLPRP